jgi:hypothetical protein
MVDLKVLTTSVADYMLKKMSKYLDMDKEFRDELTKNAIAHARDRASLCKGTTAAGSLCSRGAKDKSGYCFQHVPKKETVSSAAGRKSKKTRKHREEETVSSAARRKSKKKTRKHREEKTEDEEVETEVEEKRLEFKGGRRGLLPAQVLARAMVFPKPNYQRRYFGMLTLYRNVSSLMGFLSFAGVQGRRLDPRKVEEATEVAEKLRFEGDAILDDMEEEGKCHSSQIKEYTKAVEQKWNAVFGDSIQRIDTEVWRRMFDQQSALGNSQTKYPYFMELLQKH